MRRLTDRFRDFVGKGNAEEAAPVEETAPTPVAPAPTVAPAPVSPVGANVTVEAAYAMLNAFPKDTEDAQRLVALRLALAATVQQQDKTLQQLLADVLQEKARVFNILNAQEKNYEQQVLKITEAVDALWAKRDKLTEHHQRIALQGTERLSGLDQLIQCLSLADESTPEPVGLTEMTAPKVAEVVEEDDGPVIIRMPKMELRPLGEDSYPEAEPEPVTVAESPEPSESELPQSNRRKLYKMAA